MNRDRPFRLLVLQIAAVTAAAAAAFTLMRAGGVYLADGRLLGLSLLAVAVIYGITAAMAAYMAWVQFSTIEVTASKEAGILGEIYDLSGGLSDREEAQRLAAGIRRYIEMVLFDEWRGLADGRPDAATHELFLDVSGRLRALRARDPQDEHSIEDIHERIGPWRQLRRKRITWGLTRMPRPLWWLLCLQAWATALALMLYPCQDFPTQLACVVMGAAILGWSQLTIRDIDNPFEGYCNVSPAAFEELGQRLSIKQQARK